MPIIQPIHKGAPTAAIAQKKISIPGTRSPEGRVPVGTRMSLGRRNKQIAIKPKIANGTAAKVIFVHEVEHGSRFANTYEPHPTMGCEQSPHDNDPENDFSHTVSMYLAVKCGINR